MRLKHLLYNAANFILIIPFIMVLFTVFVVGKDLVNGVVSGKHFWFYLSMICISTSTLLSFFANRKKITLSLTDVCVTLFCLSGFIITCYHNESVSNKSILLLLILIVYFYFRIFLVQYKWNTFVLILFFMATGLIEAIWGLMQLYGFSLSQHHLFKTTGSFFNPGPYAGYLAMIIPFAFYYALNDCHTIKKKFQYVYLPFYIRWGMSTLSFLSIILVLPATMSRASWLAATAGYFVSGLVYLLKNRSLEKYIKRFRGKLIGFTLGVITLCNYEKRSHAHENRNCMDNTLVFCYGNTRYFVLFYLRTIR